MNNDGIRKALYLSLGSLGVFVLTMLVNYGAMLGWFGYTQEEISNQYKNLVTPASFSFSIWGLIYSLVLIFLLYQIYLVFKDKHQESFHRKLNILFILTCILNILWNILWVLDYIGLSTLIIVAFALVLGLINGHILENYKRDRTMVVPLGFSIYFGWLTVASVTNIAAFLVKVDWNIFGLDPSLRAGIFYVFIVLLASLGIFRIKNPSFNLTIIWALFGIFASVNSTGEGLGSNFLKAIILLGILILTCQVLYIFMKNDKKILPHRKVI